MSDEGFREFVTARSAGLQRTAWLLTGDWALAQDLVQTALARTWQHWSRLRRRDAPEVYVRQVMLSVYATWWRRKWRGEVPTEELPERLHDEDSYTRADQRVALVTALAGLSRRQRAVLVLRYFDDLTEAQTAEVLGCTVGTVKSHASKALSRLRSAPQLQALICEETKS
ncbi:SigE family RNA polymerase sigma factor [Flindersiella endophytica]